RCQIPVRLLAAIGMPAERFGIAWANMPPAGVYRLQRCADYSGSPSSLGRAWPTARPPKTAASRQVEGVRPPPRGPGLRR
ncbi:phospholipid methyltransferase, partial [Burkholderia pseudomallei]